MNILLLQSLSLSKLSPVTQPTLWCFDDDELEETAGIVDDFDFDEEMEKDLEDDDDFEDEDDDDDLDDIEDEDLDDIDDDDED